MTLDELLTEIARTPGDPRLLRALGGALGVELSRRQLGRLPDALAVLARLARTEAGFAAAYATALADLIASFQAVLAAEAEDSELAALARQAPYAEVLLALASGRETSTAIAGFLNKNKSSASRALAALRDAGLVAAFAAADGDERVRPHQLTPRGERVVEQLRHPGRRRKATPVRGARLPTAAVALTPARRDERSGERGRILPSAARKLRST
jgi:DNA-binding MarR family transcriptional regulator